MGVTDTRLQLSMEKNFIRKSGLKTAMKPGTEKHDILKDPHGDMTFESALVKSMVLLGQGNSMADFHSKFPLSLAGEVSE